MRSLQVWRWHSGPAKVTTPGQDFGRAFSSAQCRCLIPRVRLREGARAAVLSVLLLVGCASGPEPTPTATRVKSSLRPYGVVYPYPTDGWIEENRPAIRGRLEYLRGLGINTVVQTFSSRLVGSGLEQQWLMFLDEAERTEIRVVARLQPAVEWDGRAFDFDAIEGFLSIVQDHPALMGYLGLHEPLEQFDRVQLQGFYAGVKGIAPDLAIAHYMGNMAWFAKSIRFPNRDLTEGICDICITWYYPTRYLDGQPAFEEEPLRELLRTNRQLIDKRAPGAQLWFLGQAYAQQAHRRELRMPTAQEMEALYVIAEEERVDGFLWYPWLHGGYDQVLSDPLVEEQRQAVRSVYETHVSRTEGRE